MAQTCGTHQVQLCMKRIDASLPSCWEVCHSQSDLKAARESHEQKLKEICQKSREERERRTGEQAEQDQVTEDKETECH